jgi:hypothetical protein
MGASGQRLVAWPDQPPDRRQRLADLRLTEPTMRIIAIARMLLVVAVAIGAADRTAAAAEPVPAETAIEDQITQGIALRRAGKDDAALSLFLDLEKRAPESVRLLLHITTAALAAGKWTMANDYMQRASAHKDDPYYQRHKAAIENVERAIAQRVGQFRAHGFPLGAEVRLSGEVIGTLPMANAKAVEVGSYTLEVSKAGYFPLRRPVTIAGDGSLTQEDVDLREQKPFQISAAAGQTALQAVPVADTGPAPPAVWWRARWVTWSLLGVGAAAGATSGIAFAIRENDASRWNSNVCGPTNSNQTRGGVCGQTHQDIEVAQNVGLATGIAAVGFGGAALVHWLATSPHQAEVTNRPQQAQTGCTPGFGSVVCFGSF